MFVIKVVTYVHITEFQFGHSAMTRADGFDSIISEIAGLELEPRLGHAMRKHFQFEDKWVNLNHGSFGTYPKAVRTAFEAFQIASECRPDEFNFTTYLSLLDKSRAALATNLNVPVEELVFVNNVTTGVNTVLRSLVFSPGDRIIYFDFIYNACGRSVEYIEDTTPAVGVKIPVTFPISDDELVERFRETVEREQESGANIRVGIFDSIISMPGLRLPFERLVAVCKDLGVLSLVDGAHGVGNIELDLGKLDADFFVTSCHKWLYVPRGCAALHVPLRNQHLIRSTLPTSHGYQSLRDISEKNPRLSVLPPSSKSDFVAMFESVGTIDYSPILCIPAALKFREQVCGGESRIMKYSQDIAKAGAELIAKRLGTELLDRENGRCCMYNTRLPIAVGKGTAKKGEVEVESEDNHLIRGYILRTVPEKFDTSISVLYHNGYWWARISGQIYLEMSDFELAADVLQNMCERVRVKEYLQAF